MALLGLKTDDLYWRQVSAQIEGESRRCPAGRYCFPASFGKTGSEGFVVVS